jgi:hypothetical protein
MFSDVFKKYITLPENAKYQQKSLRKAAGFFL